MILLLQQIHDAYAKAPKDLEILGDAIYPGEEQSETLQDKITYAWYYAIASVLQPKSISEFGVRYGYSAIALAKGCDEKPDYYGCDSECYADMGMASHGSNNYAFKHLRPFVNGLLIQKANTSDAQLLPSDIIHIDAGHSYQETIDDLEKALPLAKYILIDDITNTDLPEVIKAADEFCFTHKLVFFDLPTFRGLRVIMIPL